MTLTDRRTVTSVTSTRDSSDVLSAAAAAGLPTTERRLPSDRTCHADARVPAAAMPWLLLFIAFGDRSDTVVGPGKGSQLIGRKAQVYT